MRPVSTTDQDLDIQNERLKAAGCEIIQSGHGRARQGKAAPSLKPSSSFCTQATSWWCCGSTGLAVLPATFSISFMKLTKQAHHSASSNRKSRRPEAWAEWSSPSSVWSPTWVLKFIKDRQRAGIDAAKSEGVYKGRKKNIDDVEIRRRVAAGATKAAVARELSVSRMTIYSALEGQPAPSEPI